MPILSRMLARLLPPLLWLVALALCAAAPLLFFVAGSSDSATTASRFRLAALPLLLAWLPLTAAIALGLRRRGRDVALFAIGPAWRALALVVLAGAIAGVAYRVGDTVAFSGDAEWAAFWAAAIALWSLAARLALMAPRARRAPA
jgi:hypothetical protein